MMGSRLIYGDIAYDPVDFVFGTALPVLLIGALIFLGISIITGVILLIVFTTRRKRRRKAEEERRRTGVGGPS